MVKSESTITKREKMTKIHVWPCSTGITKFEREKQWACMHDQVTLARLSCLAVGYMCEHTFHRLTVWKRAWGDLTVSLVFPPNALVGMKEKHQLSLNNFAPIWFLVLPRWSSTTATACQRLCRLLHWLGYLIDLLLKNHDNGRKLALR